MVSVKRLGTIWFMIFLVLLFGSIWMTPNREVQAQGNAVVTTVADITGDGAAHQLQTGGTARWVQVINVAGNSAAIRLGDLNVSATRGAAVAVGGGLMFPPLPSANLYYGLGTIYYYAAVGDKVSVVWGR